MSRRCVSVAACPCGRVPLNVRDRETCPKCGRGAPLVLRGEGPWRAEPQGRVVWGR